MAKPCGPDRPAGSPALTFAPELLLQAQGPGMGLRAAFFDVDGVLTDGSLHITEGGETAKVFNTLDGQGLKLLMQGGIVPVIITGRDSPALRRRVADLGLPHAQYGTHDKLAAAHEWLDRLSIGWEAVAAMGDDWPDLPVMTRAAFACAPPNAHAEVRAVAHHVTRERGGHGAVRECCDLLLMAAGRYASLLHDARCVLDGR